MLESERAPPALRDREVEKSHRLPRAVEADDEDRVIVAEREERVERHREAALGRVSTPRASNVLEALAHGGVELARTQCDCFEARIVQAMNGLPHLADRPALERERRGVHDGFVPVVERA